MTMIDPCEKKEERTHVLINAKQYSFRKINTVGRVLDVLVTLASELIVEPAAKYLNLFNVTEFGQILSSPSAGSVVFTLYRPPAS